MDINKALEIKPNSALALGFRGRLYAGRKEHHKAVDDLGAAIALAPQTISYRIERGRSLEALGRTADALSDYQAAIALKPVSMGDVLSQSIARLRVNALTGGRPGSGPRPGGDCVKGQTCL